MEGLHHASLVRSSLYINLFFVLNLEKLPIRLNSHISLRELRITQLFHFFFRIGLSSNLLLSCCDGLKLLSDGYNLYKQQLVLTYPEHYFANMIFMSTSIWMSF